LGGRPDGKRKKKKNWVGKEKSLWLISYRNIPSNLRGGRGKGRERSPTPARGGERASGTTGRLMTSSGKGQKEADGKKRKYQSENIYRKDQIRNYGDCRMTS